MTFTPEELKIITGGSYKPTAEKKADKTSVLADIADGLSGRPDRNEKEVSDKDFSYWQGIAEVGKGLGRGLAGTALTGVQGGAGIVKALADQFGIEGVPNVEESAAAKWARDATKHVFDKGWFAAKKGYGTTSAARFGDALGSVGTFAIPGLGQMGLAAKAPAVAKALGMSQWGLAASVGAGEQADRIIARIEAGHSISQADQNRAILWGSAIGLSEVGPVRLAMAPLKKLLGGMSKDLPKSVKGKIWGALTRSLMTGGAEGLQEALAMLAQDFTERNIYNPNLKIGQTMLEEFKYGAGAGATFRAVMEAMAASAGRRNSRAYKKQIRKQLEQARSAYDESTKPDEGVERTPLASLAVGPQAPSLAITPIKQDESVEDYATRIVTDVAGDLPGGPYTVKQGRKGFVVVGINDARVGQSFAEQDKADELSQKLNELTPILEAQKDQDIASKAKLSANERETKNLLQAARDTQLPQQVAYDQLSTAQIAKLHNSRSSRGLSPKEYYTANELLEGGISQESVTALLAENNPRPDFIKPEHIRSLAESKNIRWSNSPEFNRLAKRLTGTGSLNRMNQVQLSTMKAALEKMPGEEFVTQSYAEQDFTQDQVNAAREKIQDGATIADIKRYTGIKGNKAARQIRDALVEEGVLERVGRSNRYRAKEAEPEVQETFIPNEIEDALKDRLRSIGPNDAGLKLVESILDGQADGKAAKRTIELAKDIVKDSPDQQSELIDTLNHEVIHLMREADLFTDAEWTNLKEFSYTNLVPGSEKTFYQQAFEDYVTNAADKGVAPMRFQEDVYEEAVAEAFRYWVRDPSAIQAPAKTRSLFERIWDFLKRLGGFVKEKDGAKVLKAIDRGEFSDRRRGVVRAEETARPEILAQAGLSDLVEETDVGRIIDQSGEGRRADFYSLASSAQQWRSNVFPYLQRGYKIKTPKTPSRWWPKNTRYTRALENVNRLFEEFSSGLDPVPIRVSEQAKRVYAWANQKKGASEAEYADLLANDLTNQAIGNLKDALEQQPYASPEQKQIVDLAKALANGDRSGVKEITGPLIEDNDIKRQYRVWSFEGARTLEEEMRAQMYPPPGKTARYKLHPQTENESTAIEPDDRYKFKRKKSLAGETMYHGSKTLRDPMEADVQQTNPLDLVGPGFYLTDNYWLANSYVQARPTTEEDFQAGNVLSVKIKDDTKLLDLEEKLPLEVEQEFEMAFQMLQSLGLDVVRPNGDDRSGMAWTNMLRSSMEKMVEDRFDLSSENIADFHAYWETLIDGLRSLGYDGFQHVGGTIAGSNEVNHNVAVLWEPSEAFDAELMEFPTREEQWSKIIEREYVDDMPANKYFDHVAMHSAMKHAWPNKPDGRKHIAYMPFSDLKKILQDGQAGPQLLKTENVKKGLDQFNSVPSLFGQLDEDGNFNVTKVGNKANLPIMEGVFQSDTEVPVSLNTASSPVSFKDSGFSGDVFYDGVDYAVNSATGVDKAPVVEGRQTSGKNIPKTSIGPFLTDRFAFGDRKPVPIAQDISAKWREDNGYGPGIVGQQDPPVDYLKRVADFIEEAQHAPQDPEVQKAYKALGNMVIAQYELLGDIDIEAYKGDGEPYSNSQAMLDDLANNNHLYFFMTENGFGESPDTVDHPMLAKTKFKNTDGEPMLLNDIFRVVHDFFGHAQNATTFGAKGEYNAFHEHATMVPREALPALAAETLAQNAWVNYGRHLRREDGTVPGRQDKDWIPLEDRPFSDQKAFVVPEELLADDPWHGEFSDQDRTEFARYALNKKNPQTSDQQQQLIDDIFAPSPQSLGEVVLENMRHKPGRAANRTIIRQKLLDKYARIGELGDQAAQSDRDLMADSSAIAAARFADRSVGVLASSFKHGIPKYENGYTRVDDLYDDQGKKLGGLLNIMSRVGRENLWKEFGAYSAAVRAQRLMQEGRENFLTPQQIQTGLSLGQTYSWFEGVRQNYQKWNDGIVQFMVDTGVIDQKAADTWTAYQDYVPFYREAEGQDIALLKGKGLGMFGGIVGQKPPKKLKGGDRAFKGDWVELVTQNARAAIDMGMRNVAAQRAMRDAKMVGLATENKEKQAGDLTIRVQGKDRHFSVDDPLLIDALTAMAPADLSGIVKAIGMPSMWLRELVTRDPGFMLANGLRDTVSAWVTTGRNFTPVLGTARGVAESVIGTDVNAELQRTGAFGGHDFVGDIKNAAGSFKARYSKNPFTKIWLGLERATEASDAATRNAVYRATLKETGNPAQAAFEALEVINFSRRGSLRAMNIMTSWIPFLNARLQGLDIIYRAFKGEGTGKGSGVNKTLAQRRGTIRGMMLLASTIAYYQMMSDEDEWKQATDAERDGNWLFKVGDKTIKIPIPFEIGVMFKTVPERLMAWMDGQDTDEDMKSAMRRSIMETLRINPLPQIVIPPIEAISNYSLYRGRPIEPFFMTGLETKDRYTEYTSELSKIIGPMFGVPPIRLDHMLRGYTGTLGSYFMMAMHEIFSGAQGKVTPSYRIDQYPVIKRFLQTEIPRGDLDKFYEMLNLVRSTKASINRAKRSGDTSRYMELLSDPKYRNRYTLSRSIERIARQISKINQMRNRIIISQNITAKQKRLELDMLDRMKNNLVRQMASFRQEVQ